MGTLVVTWNTRFFLALFRWPSLGLPPQLYLAGAVMLTTKRLQSAVEYNRICTVCVIAADDPFGS